MKFKIGDKIKVVEQIAGLARKGSTGTVVSDNSWENDRNGSCYSLGETYYKLKLRGISNPNNNIIIKI